MPRVALETRHAQRLVSVVASRLEAPTLSLPDAIMRFMTGAVSEQRAALLALTRAATPKDVRTALAASDGDALQALEAITGIASLDQPSVEQRLDQAVESYQRWAADGITVVTVLDPGYPQNLHTVYDRPPVLWIRGELDAQDARSIAVVGTRQVSADGLRRARRITRLLVDEGFTIVSGLAKGVDTAAHTAAIEAGGRTLAVLGTGVDRFYPRENHQLQQRIARDFAVVSQFEPDATGRAWTFPQRNATMSGLTQATIVIEASETSGARTQARLALSHGRPVVLLRSLIETHEWARKMSEKPGVRVLNDGDLPDVLAYIQADDGAQLSLI